MPSERGIRIGFLGRIVIALAAAGLIPVALVSFRLSDLNREAMNDQVLQTHSLSANSGADQIERMLSGWETVADALIANPSIQNDPASEGAREAVRVLISSRSDLAGAAIDDGAGGEVFRGQKKSTAGAVTALLGEKERPPLVLRQIDGRYWLSVTRPIPAGRTTLVFDASAVADSMRTDELGEQALRLIVDRNRRLVVGRQQALDSLPRELLDLAVHGEVRGSRKFTLSGSREAIGAYSPIAGTPWVVISAQPATVAEQIAATLRRRSLSAIAAALLLVGGLSFAAYLVVVRPVHDLLEAQAEMGVIAGSGSDVDRLRQSIDLLQRRVRDRAQLGKVFLGRFEVLEIVGQGGMGTVFRGWDPTLQRPVALKTIKLAEAAEPSDSQGMISALLREAITVAQFHDSNIVAVYDVQESPDAAFIAMEFVDGTTLESCLDEKPLSLGQTVAVGVAVASALETAHAGGVIHRDIKPANTLVARDGVIKVTDFGIADLLNAVRTDKKSVFGTPAYMAPEIIRGRAASPASDLFSLGVVLYRCLTAVSPFERETMQGTIDSVLKRTPPPPSSLNAAVPPELDVIVIRLLAKSVEERIASSSELLAVLRPLSAERRLVQSAPTGKPHHTARKQDPMYVPTVAI